jgi:hypothetical protein
MLSPGDADLARRDPDIPGLATVLDPEAMLAFLRPEVLDLVSLVPTYVRYKPGTNCLVAYRLTTMTGDEIRYAKAFRRSDVGKLQKLAEGNLQLGRQMVGVATAASDGEVKAMSLLADDRGRRHLLQRLLPSRPDLWEAKIRPLHYKPERRFVACLQRGTEPLALLKAYKPHDYERARVAHKSVSSVGGLRTARRIGSLDRHSLIALEWLNGRKLGWGGENPDTFHRIGAGLRILHEQSRWKLQPLLRETEAQRLEGAAEAAAWLLPGRAEVIVGLARELAGRIAGFPDVCRPIHGDFSASQVLVGSEVALLDYDEGVLGDPAADLGSFAADAQMKVAQGQLAESSADGIVDRLVEGYGDDGDGSLRHRVDTYAAARLLAVKASKPFRYRWSNWQEMAGMIVDRGRELAGR